MPAERAGAASGLNRPPDGVVASRRLAVYLGIATAGLLAAVLFGRPEAVALVAPLLLLPALALAAAETPRLGIVISQSRERAVEGSEVDLSISLESDRPLWGLRFDLAPGREVLARRLAAAAAELRPGVVVEAHWALRCRRWGGRRGGTLTVSAQDRFGLFHYRWAELPLPGLRVYPSADTLQRLLTPARPQALAGDDVSNLRGDGIEFGGIRQFLPGDRIRHVNWRATARRGTLQVNELRPERNADVVIFLDTFSELGAGAGNSLDRAVRAAGSIAGTYLRSRDRVGLIGFGGTLRWLAPGLGQRQAYRIADALIESEVLFSYAWKGLEVIPPRTLPPAALVVAITPLLDERSLRALLDLRGRGHDLIVVEVSPLDFLPPPREEAAHLARRLWEMERQTLRTHFASIGAPVVRWDAGHSLAEPLLLAARFRRERRLVAPR